MQIEEGWKGAFKNIFFNSETSLCLPTVLDKNWIWKWQNIGKQKFRGLMMESVFVS